MARFRNKDATHQGVLTLLSYSYTQFLHYFPNSLTELTVSILPSSPQTCLGNKQNNAFAAYVWGDSWDVRFPACTESQYIYLRVLRSSHWKENHLILQSVIEDPRLSWFDPFPSLVLTRYRVSLVNLLTQTSQQGSTTKASRDEHSHYTPSHFMFYITVRSNCEIKYRIQKTENKLSP